MATCTACGTQNPSSKKFCTSCGQILPVEKRFGARYRVVRLPADTTAIDFQRASYDQGAGMRITAAGWVVFAVWLSVVDLSYADSKKNLSEILFRNDTDATIRINTVS